MLIYLSVYCGYKRILTNVKIFHVLIGCKLFIKAILCFCCVFCFVPVSYDAYLLPICKVIIGVQSHESLYFDARIFSFYMMRRTGIASISSMCNIFCLRLPCNYQVVTDRIDNFGRYILELDVIFPFVPITFFCNWLCAESSVG